jgi:hypothetical protein
MKYITYCLFSVMLCGCTQIETENIPNDRLTVEGYIDNNRFATVKLTNSIAFEGIIDSTEIVKAIESKAKVELSNGRISEVLTLKRDDTSFPFLFYRSNLIKGNLEDRYALTVSIRGKVFESNTSIPDKPEVAAIEFLDAREEGMRLKDFKDIRLTLNNITSKQQYFKILIKTKAEETFQFANPFIVSTENITTETFPIIVTYKVLVDGEKTNLLKVGELIDLRVIAITKAQFEFWKSVEGDVTIPIDNASFTNAIETNISNGAFGYWSGEHETALQFRIL